MFFTAFFFFNDTATTEIYTLSLHDALPIYPPKRRRLRRAPRRSAAGAPPSRPVGPRGAAPGGGRGRRDRAGGPGRWRSEEHTSELQSRQYLVCRLLLEKKKKSNVPTRALAW